MDDQRHGGSYSIYASSNFERSIALPALIDITFFKILEEGGSEYVSTE
ncbi:MAG: hypothetical protein MJ128_05445 [Mogibacterium sp.]|nr:hypothetical protein [Mogibacterium sp.]